MRSRRSEFRLCSAQPPNPWLVTMTAVRNRVKTTIHPLRPKEPRTTRLCSEAPFCSFAWSIRGRTALLCVFNAQAVAQRAHRGSPPPPAFNHPLASTGLSAALSDVPITLLLLLLVPTQTAPPPSPFPRLESFRKCASAAPPALFSWFSAQTP